MPQNVSEIQFYLQGFYARNMTIVFSILSQEVQLQWTPCI